MKFPGFTDTTNDFWKTQIYCIVKYGYAQGVTSTTYQPGRNVTRAEMAAFVGRFAKKAGLTWNTAPHGFTDISNQSQEFQDDINALANAGVVSGKTQTTYGPTQSVTRAQMAKFIANSLVKTGIKQAGSAGTNDYFADDDNIAGGLEPYINDLAADKVVQGIDVNNYAPGRSVLRDQMAGFIARANELAVEAGKVANAFPPPGPAVSPSSATQKTAGASYTDTKSVQQYTVSGLDSTKTYSITLFPCTGTKAPSTSGGTTTFPPTTTNTAGPAAGQNSTNAGTGGANGVEITSVNGAPITTAKSFNNVTPTSGGITFTVNSNAQDCGIPVVYQDANNNGTFDVSANGTPSETYGMGGALTYIPVAAQGGAFTIPAGGITQVMHATSTSGSFIGTPNSGPDSGNPVTYSYDSNDQFQVGSVPVTEATFLAKLSAGDGMNAPSTYATDTAATSIFNLNDAAPAPPASLTASQPTTATDTSATLTIGDSTTASVASYNVYRATKSAVGGDCPGAGAAAAPTSAAWSKVGSVADKDPTTGSGSAVTFTDTGLTPSTAYCYAATSVDASGQESSNAQYASNGAGGYTTTATPQPATPASVSSAFSDADGSGTVNKGDIAGFTFDQNVTVGSTYSFTVTDADGTNAQIDNTNSTCTASGKTVTCTLTANPLITAIGGNAVEDWGVNEVLSATGISNTVGNWNLLKSGFTGFSRVLDGANTNLPAAPTAITATSPNTVAATCSAASTTADTINVYDIKGNLIGQGACTGASSAITVTTTTAFAAGDKLWVTEKYNGNATNFNYESQSAQATAN